MSSRLLLLPALPLFAAAQAISFLPPTGFVGGGASVVDACPHCVVIADFNGDGKPDIAYNTIPLVPEGGVLLGNGDGTFRRSLAFPYPAPGSIFGGDFNGDGKPDLVSGNSLYFGTGDGAFRYPIPITGCPNNPQVADFNRDGKTDILCGTTLLVSNGDGSFTTAGTAGKVALESVALIADFNGDGVPDVLLLQLSGTLAVVFGHGDGTFGSEIPLSYGLHPQPPPTSSRVISTETGSSISSISPHAATASISCPETETAHSAPLSRRIFPQTRFQAP